MVISPIFACNQTLPGTMPKMTKKGEKLPIPSFGFQGSDMPSTENYTAWREAVATLFDVDLQGRSDLGPFVADLQTYAMGSVLFGLARASAQRFTRSTETIARSGVDHIIVQLYMNGGYTGMAGEHPIAVAAGDICVLDFAETVETLATDFEALTIVIPRIMIEQRLTHGSLHGLVLKASSPLTKVLAQHFITLFQYAPSMTFDECEAVIDGTIALILACLRGELEARDMQESSASTISLSTIRRYINEHLADPTLSAEEIARHFALSRASLYRLFEPMGGIADYIRRKRMHRAFFDVISPRLADKRISEIARRWQFTSESSFARAFKATYGISPSAARETSVLTKTGLSDTSKDTKQPPLSLWMREISSPKSN
jgi:AraC-like DNA-binding protein